MWYILTKTQKFIYFAATSGQNFSTTLLAQDTVFFVEEGWKCSEYTMT